MIIRTKNLIGYSTVICWLVQAIVSPVVWAVREECMVPSLSRVLSGTVGGAELETDCSSSSSGSLVSSSEFVAQLLLTPDDEGVPHPVMKVEENRLYWQSLPTPFLDVEVLNKPLDDGLIAEIKRLGFLPLYRWLTTLPEDLSLEAESSIYQAINSWSRLQAFMAAHQSSGITHRDVVDAVYPLSRVQLQYPGSDFTERSLEDLLVVNRLTHEASPATGVVLHKVLRQEKSSLERTDATDREYLIGDILSRWDLGDKREEKTSVLVRLVARSLQTDHISFLHPSWKTAADKALRADIDDEGAFLGLCSQLGIDFKEAEEQASVREGEDQYVPLVHQVVRTLTSSAVKNLEVLARAGLDLEQQDTEGLTPLDRLMKDVLEAKSPHAVHQSLWQAFIDKGAGARADSSLLVRYENFLRLPFHHSRLSEGMERSFETLLARHLGYAWEHNKNFALKEPRVGMRGLEVKTKSGLKIWHDPEQQLFDERIQFKPKKSNWPSGAISSKEFKKDGSHLVGYYDLPNGQRLCLKRWPEIPGIEVSVHHLMNQLFNRGTVPGEVVRMVDTIYYLSQYVPGLRLDEVLESKPTLLNHLDPDTTAEAILGAILTNPEDGRPPNYILNPLSNGMYQIVPIDSDHSLGVAAPQEVKVGLSSKETLKGQSVLFCLDQMKEPLHSSVRLKFARMVSPDGILHRWLEVLKKEEEYYQGLASLREVEQFYRSHGTVLGLPLTVGMLDRLYHKLDKLRDLVSDTANPLRPIDILRELEPSVAGRYARVLDRTSSVLERYKQTDGRLSSCTTSKGYMKAHEADTPLRTIEAAVNSLDRIVIEHHLDILGSRKEDFRALQTARAREKFVEGNIEWSKIGDKEAQAWLTLIKQEGHPGDWNSLVLINSRGISDKTLAVWPFNNLRHLDLSGTEPLTGNNMPALADATPGLSILKLNNMPRFVKFYARVFGDNKRPYWPVLKRLEMMHNPNMVGIKVVAPNLKVLLANDSPKLEFIGVGSESLEEIDVSGCINLTELKLEAPQLRILQAANDAKLKAVDIGSTMLEKLDVSGCELFDDDSLEKVTMPIPVGHEFRIFYDNTTISKSVQTLLEKVYEGTFTDEDVSKFFESPESPFLSWKIYWLGRALNTSTKLRCLRLKPRDLPMLQAFTKILEKNTVLRELNLSHNGIGTVGAQALAQALEKNTTLQWLNFHGRGVGNVDVRSLARALERNTVLRVLDLMANEIDRAGMEALAQALKKNTVLRELNLSDNGIGTVGAQALAQALEKNTTLQSLNITLNNIKDDGAQVLAKTLKCNTVLRELYIGSNFIECTGAETFGSALMTNTVLRVLDLMNNEIDHAGIQALAQALEKNTVLRELNLSHNGIGTVGAQAVAKALKNNVTLRTLDFGNNRSGDAGAYAFALSLSQSSILKWVSTIINYVWWGKKRILEKYSKMNTTLQTLNLASNHIGDAGAQQLSYALYKNTVLQSLDLRNNEIGDVLLKEINTLLNRNRELPIARSLAAILERKEFPVEDPATQSAQERLDFRPDTLSPSIWGKIETKGWSVDKGFRETEGDGFMALLSLQGHDISNFKFLRSLEIAAEEYGYRGAVVRLFDEVVGSGLGGVAALGLGSPQCEGGKILRHPRVLGVLNVLEGQVDSNILSLLFGRETSSFRNLLMPVTVSYEESGDVRFLTRDEALWNDELNNPLLDLATAVLQSSDVDSTLLGLQSLKDRNILGDKSPYVLALGAQWDSPYVHGQLWDVKGLRYDRIPPELSSFEEKEKADSIARFLTENRARHSDPESFWSRRPAPAPTVIPEPLDFEAAQEEALWMLQELDEQQLRDRYDQALREEEERRQDWKAIRACGSTLDNPDERVSQIITVYTKRLEDKQTSRLEKAKDFINKFMRNIQTEALSSEGERQGAVDQAYERYIESLQRRGEDRMSPLEKLRYFYDWKRHLFYESLLSHIRHSFWSCELLAQGRVQRKPEMIERGTSLLFSVLDLAPIPHVGTVGKVIKRAVGWATDEKIARLGNTLTSLYGRKGAKALEETSEALAQGLGVRFMDSEVHLLTPNSIDRLAKMCVGYVLQYAGDRETPTGLEHLINVEFKPEGFERLTQAIELLDRDDSVDSKVNAWELLQGRETTLTEPGRAKKLLLLIHQNAHLVEYAFRATDAMGHGV